MSRGVWIIRNDELIPKHLAPPLHRKFADAPMVISDCMDLTMNHADGRRYDSKRAYEKAVRRAGCHIIGNETPKLAAPYEPDDPIEDIRAGIEIAESRAPRAKRKRRMKNG